MTDTERSEDDLRDLLHRAADELVVRAAELPTQQSIETTASRSHRGRWLAAAAVLVVLVGGATWWAIGPDGETIDAGPAESTGSTGLRAVVEDPGIWRLPDDESGLKVTQAIESIVRVPRFFAVDDPAAPTRLLMISPGGYFDPSAQDAPPSRPFVGTTTIATLASDTPDGLSWSQVTGESSTGYLTAASIGIAEGEVETLLGKLVAQITADGGSLTDVGAVTAALAEPTLPVGLVQLWEPVSVAGTLDAEDDATPGPASTLALFIDAAGEMERIVILLRVLGLPGPVARWWTELQAGLEPPTRWMTPAPELGPGVLVGMVGEDRTATVITDDGVEISVGRVAVGEVGATGVGEALSVEEQLEVISSLRAMSERELRDALADQGVALSDHWSDAGG